MSQRSQASHKENSEEKRHNAPSTTFIPSYVWFYKRPIGRMYRLALGEDARVSPLSSQDGFADFFLMPNPRSHHVRSGPVTDGSPEEAKASANRDTWRTILESTVAKVTAAEARPLNVPLIAPFTIATTKLESVHNVGIRVELSDGSVGWGEAPTLPPVTAEDQNIALRKASECCGMLMERSPMNSMRLLQDVGSYLPGHDFASARAGVEMALIDAVARSVGLPLWKFFGGATNSVTTDITIPICEPGDAAVLASEYAQRGFHTVKTKVGGRSVSSDIAMLHAIRSNHPKCSLILDANEGYTADEALKVLKDLYGAGVSPLLFEQPVARDDWDGLAVVTRKAKDLYDVPVAADESCRSVKDAERIIGEKIAGVINVKLAKIGVLGTLEVVSLAQRTGVDLMIGGMVETRIAMGFAGHLAAGFGFFKFVDLDTPLLLAEDPVHGGYEVEGPVYTFTDAKGHGASLVWS